MGNTIGKISGYDWSKAPAQATHALRPMVSSCDGKGIWYCKDEQGAWVVYKFSPWGTGELAWYHSWNQAISDKCFISKEEDLAGARKDLTMNKVKEVKGIKDITVGMFLKSGGFDPRTRIVLSTAGGSMVTALINDYTPKQDKVYDWGKNLPSHVVSWSYTYDGEYTPIIHESETDVKLRELQATIDDAQRQITELRGK